MPFNLKTYLHGPYASYNAVQATNVLLGVVIIHNWPQLNTWPFWLALAAYAIAFATSIHIYARYSTCESPVRISYLIGITVLFLIATSTRQDWWTWTGFTLLAPLTSIVFISGVLYNWVLAGVRLWFYPLRTTPKPTRHND